MTPGQILIVSDDSEFTESLMSRWREEGDAPAFTAVSTEVSRQASPLGYELVVVGPLRRGAPRQSAPAFPTDTLVCAVGEVEALKAVRARHEDWLLLPEYPGWTKILFSLAREVSRRTMAETRAREAEKTTQFEKRFGAIGKSVLEARPGMVNALTSLLGNADLILLSDDQLPADYREHVQTIHTMALRLNEVVQRLSSLENEIELSERKSHLETPAARLAETLKK